MGEGVPNVLIRWQKKGNGDCLTKTQDFAKFKDDV